MTRLHEAKAMLLGLALVSAGIGLQLGFHAPLTPDGAGYIGIAHQLLHYGRLADPVGFMGLSVPSEDLHWPPGYPILIAGLNEIGLSPIVAGLLLAMGSAVASALLLVRMALQWLPATSRRLALFWLASAYPVWSLGSWVLSDALLLLVTTLCLWVFTRPSSTHSLLLLAFVVALAPWLRWNGIVLLPLVLLRVWADRPRLRQILLAGLVAAVVLLPLVLWRLHTGDPPRNDDPTLYRHLRGSVAAASMVVPGFLLVVLAARGRTAALPSQVKWAGLYLFLVIPGFHFLISLLFKISPLDYRFLLPALPGLLVLAVIIAGRLPAGESEPRAWIMAVSIAILFLVPLAHTLRAARLDRSPAMSDLEAIGQALPAQSETPILTAVPELAAVRPDLLWRRLQDAPNGPQIPACDALSRHPESRLAVVRREQGLQPCRGELCLLDLSEFCLRP